MFTTGSILGVPILAWLIIVVMGVVFIIAKLISSRAKVKKEKEKEKEKEENAKRLADNLLAQSANENSKTPTQVKEVQPVKKKSWLNVNSFLGFIPPIFIALIAYAIFTDNIHIGIPYGNFWLILGLIVCLLFIYMSNTCEKIVAPTTLVILAVLLIGLIKIVMWIPNLMGTPEAVLMIPVDIGSNKSLVYDASVPRWTGYYLEIPNNTWLEITANGRQHFPGRSTLFKNDGVKSCGPEGATFNVAYIKGNDVDFSKPHLPHPDNFLIPGGKYAALIGKVGEDGLPFAIGKYRKIFIENGGLLFISTNIKWVNPPSGDWKFNWKGNFGKIYLSVKMSPKV